MSRWTDADLAALQKRRQQGKSAPGEAIPIQASKRAKYGNKAVLVAFGASGELVSGHVRLEHRFDSLKEAKQYEALALRRRAGEIKNLVLQEPLPLIARRPDGGAAIVGEWYADFVYDDLTDGRRHYVDVKSDGTRGIETFRLKRKIVEACHAIVIEEV